MNYHDDLLIENSEIDPNKVMPGDPREILDQKSVRFNSVHSVHEAQEIAKRDFPASEGWECTHFEIIDAKGDTIDVVVTFTKFADLKFEIHRPR